MREPWQVMHTHTGRGPARIARPRVPLQVEHGATQVDVRHRG